MQEDILEAFRAPLFFAYISVLLTFCVASGSQLGDRVELQFSAYRLQQIEVNGNVLGSKSYKMSHEATSIDSTIFRRCTVVTWRELANRDWSFLLQNSVNAILLILPADYAALSPPDAELFRSLEATIAALQTDLTVYAVTLNEATAALSAEISSTKAITSGAAQLWHAISANTIMLTSSSSAPATLTYQPKNVVTRLGGATHNAPTIAFVAHYDSHAVFPELGVGADSNGSGVVALLELLALMKKFYERPSTRPNYHMIFVWSAAGKHNYQGTRAFLEELHDKYPDDKVELAICLDMIGNGKSLNVHVGKVPTEGSTIDRFVRNLRFAAPNQSVEIVAKKINIHQPLSWEHEPFNIKRLAALSLSRLPSADDAARRSLTDAAVDVDVLASNVRSIAEATLSMALTLPEKSSAHKDARVSADSSLLSKDAVSKARIRVLLSRFAATARPVSNRAATETIADNIAALAGSYAHTRQQSVTLEVPVTASGVESIVAEKTKPALFDLLLGGIITAYIALLMKVVSSSQNLLDSAVSVLRKS